MLPSAFPTEYRETVNGSEISLPFHTDFVQWMRFEELISDSRIPEDMLIITALRMIFPERLPLDLSRGALFMLWFYRCGKPPEKVSAAGNISLTESRRIYSFDEDFDYIAAAFMEKYHIDLWETHMHWWKFHALLTGLHDCRFTEIAGYRGMDMSEDMTDSRRRFIENMQENYALHVSANELRRIERAQKYLDGEGVIYWQTAP